MDRGVNEYRYLNSKEKVDERREKVDKAIDKHWEETHGVNKSQANMVNKKERTTMMKGKKATIITQVLGPNYKDMEDRHLNKFVDIIKNPEVLDEGEKDQITKRVENNIRYSMTYGMASAQNTNKEIEHLRRVGNSQRRALSSIRAGMASTGKSLIGIGKNSKGRGKSQFSNKYSGNRSASYSDFSPNK
jgi:hypothetical protein